MAQRERRGWGWGRGGGMGDGWRGWSDGRWVLDGGRWCCGVIILGEDYLRCAGVSEVRACSSAKLSASERCVRAWLLFFFRWFLD